MRKWEEMGKGKRKEWGRERKRGRKRGRRKRKEWGWGRQYVSISKVGCNTCNDRIIQHET